MEIVPPSLSIYRGYSAEGGIGETPGDMPGEIRGEQYLAADQELWRENNLGNAARKWMTLYDDYSIAETAVQTERSIEGWSYFGYRNLRFVVRLIPNGKIGPRPAYFSHGQAWDIEKFHNGYDPGAFLGYSEAFHGPWIEGQPLQAVAPVQPDAFWRETIQAKPWAAIRLLAQLYRACVTGCPVVMAVPLAEFTAGSRVHQLVSFARAALPLSIKRDCRIRLFTGRPEAFLGELKTHLVAVPEELASAALMTRPDAALLDRECQLRSGPAADTAYAERVVERALKLPHYLLPFTGRLKFTAARLPTADELSMVHACYNVAAACGDQAKMDSLLDHLREEGADGNASRDWSGVIQPQEWRQFSLRKLKELALSPAKSPGLAALRQIAREELARRAITLDNDALPWLASLSDSLRSQEEMALLQANLLSRPVLYPGGNSGEGAATTAEDLRWVIRRAKEAPEFRSMIDQKIANQVAGRRIPAGVTEGDLTILAAPDPNLQLENYLNWAEFLDMAFSSEGRRRIVDLERRLTDFGQRRNLIGLLQKPQWQALKKYFVSPTAWDKDVGDLLLQSPQQLSKITDIQRLLALAPSSQPIPGKLLGMLDEQMRTQPEQTTRSLVRAGRWLAWRLGTALTDFRGFAMLWLLNAPDGASLEEWKQVVLDLGHLSTADLRQLRINRKSPKPPWPQIPLCEDVQLADLAELSADLGVAAQLAEAVDPGNRDNAYGKVLEYFRSAHPVPAALTEESFRCLSRGESSDSRIGLEEAKSLVQLSGDRQKQALGVMGSAVLRNLLERPAEAEAAANEARLWETASFRQRVSDWLQKHRLNPAVPRESEVLALLSRHMPGSSLMDQEVEKGQQKPADETAVKRKKAGGRRPNKRVLVLVVMISALTVVLGMAVFVLMESLPSNSPEAFAAAKKAAQNTAKDAKEEASRAHDTAIKAKGIALTANASEIVNQAENVAADAIKIKEMADTAATHASESENLQQAKAASLEATKADKRAIQAVVDADNLKMKADVAENKVHANKTPEELKKNLQQAKQLAGSEAKQAQSTAKQALKTATSADAGAKKAKIGEVITLANQAVNDAQKALSDADTASKTARVAGNIDQAQAAQKQARDAEDLARWAIKSAEEVQQKIASAKPADPKQELERVKREAIEKAQLAKAIAEQAKKTAEQLRKEAQQAKAHDSETSLKDLINDLKKVYDFARIAKITAEKAKDIDAANTALALAKKAADDAENATKKISGARESLSKEGNKNKSKTAIDFVDEAQKFADASQQSANDAENSADQAENFAEEAKNKAKGSSDVHVVSVIHSLTRAEYEARVSSQQANSAANRAKNAASAAAAAASNADLEATRAHWQDAKTAADESATANKSAKKARDEAERLKRKIEDSVLH